MSERTPFTDVPDVDVRLREPMALHTTFRVGGPARYFLVPQTPAALLACVRRAHAANVPLYPMGAGRTSSWPIADTTAPSFASIAT